MPIPQIEDYAPLQKERIELQNTLPAALRPGVVSGAKCAWPLKTGTIVENISSICSSHSAIPFEYIPRILLQRLSYLYLVVMDILLLLNASWERFRRAVLRGRS